MVAIVGRSYPVEYNVSQKKVLSVMMVIHKTESFCQSPVTNFSENSMSKLLPFALKITS